MVRLPVPGEDAGNWGAILNSYLSQSIDSTGGIKAGAISSLQLADQAIVRTKLSSDVQSSLVRADASVQLAGDLGGTIATPVVQKINGVTLPVSAPQAGQVLMATGATTAAWSASTSAPTRYIDPAQYGAIGNGVTDDTAALNNAYTAARTLQLPVNLCGRSYKTSNAIHANGTSTIGGDGRIIFVGPSTAGSAFNWGGDLNSVDHVIFDLTNTTSDVAMQGIYNGYNNVRSQSFTNCRVICRSTHLSGTGSTIYGVWFNGTGLSGVTISSNYIVGASYAVQVNAQNSSQQAVMTAPIGSPSSGVSIIGNEVIDGVIGVNTPGIYCTRVRISGNSVSPTNYVLEMPINIAHVQQCIIEGNTLIDNGAGNHGVIHIEDVSGELIIVHNTVSVTASNHGIIVGLVSGASGDTATPGKFTISGNRIIGTSSPNNYGIVVNDTVSIDGIISTNYVKAFVQGIAINARTSVTNNTIDTCTAGITLDGSGLIEGNTYLNCTAAYSTSTIGGVQGETIRAGSGLLPTKTTTARGVYTHYKGVNFEATGPITILNNVAFTVIALPAGRFDGFVTVYVPAIGFWRFHIAWDGSTFTGTQLANGVYGAVGSTMTLTRTADPLLQASVFIGGSGSVVVNNIAVTIDDLVY